MTSRKRFIAGARCPRCQQLDKLVMFEQMHNYVFECVACAYSETMSKLDETAAKQNDAVQALRFVEPKSEPEGRD